MDRPTQAQLPSLGTDAQNPRPWGVFGGPLINITCGPRKWGCGDHLYPSLLSLLILYHLQIIGGTFTSNKAGLGGFLYVEGDGLTSCEGASVGKNSGLDGGAIYAVKATVVDWACHLIANEALLGPAM